MFRTVTQDMPELFDSAVNDLYAIANTNGMTDDNATQKILDAARSDAADAPSSPPTGANGHAAAAADNVTAALDGKSDMDGHAAAPPPKGPEDYGATILRTPGMTLPEAKPALVSKTEFLTAYTPPDWLWDGILQRRFVYSLTAKTGDGKTAVALLGSRVVAVTRPP